MRRNKRKDLIPLEKSRKVIHVMPRGGYGKVYWLLGLLMIVLALTCFCYGVSIKAMNTGSNFYLVWLLLGTYGVLCVLLSWKPKWRKRIPKWVMRTFIGISIAGLAFLIGLGTTIYCSAPRTASPGADYLIILGAQWRANGPSTILKYRLDKAVDYLLENPDTQVIVSGAQGPNEVISEAEGMASYLQGAGIPEDKISLEDQAVNTYQNLQNSSAFLDKSKRVIVVTNDFHVFRSVALGKAMGYEQIEGLAADSHPYTLAQNLLRECVAVMKEFVLGRL